MHQAALASVPVTPSHISTESIAVSQSLYERKRRRIPHTSIAVRDDEGTIDSVSELARRVEALSNITVEETSAPPTPLEFTESELLAFYEDVLAFPPAEQAPIEPSEASQDEKDRALIQAVADRYMSATANPPHVFDTASPSFSSILQQRSPRNGQDYSFFFDNHISEQSPLPTHRRILPKIQQIVSGLEAVRKSLRPVAGNLAHQTAHQTAHVPISLLTHEEWKALVRVCLREGDTESAEVWLELMKRSDLTPLEESFNDIMSIYATKGDIAGIEKFMRKHISGRPTDRQRHLHVKSHENSVPAGTVPTSALNLLHYYESQSLPAPMTTYTRLIISLLSTRSSIAQAQAWDLFAHMRYVAHPQPDAFLYTVMIRACASSPFSKSEPERALDLFTEMTVDRRLPPTAGAYAAVILACARSGSKAYVSEAFRLAKEMLDAHRDASGHSAFRPDTRTCAALLEGAKRIGDLSRVRWILAEMVRGVQKESRESETPVGAEITEEIMMHVFHAYAAYRPPFRRSTAPLVQQIKARSTGSKPVPDESGPRSFLSKNADASTTPPPPSSPVEVLEGPSFRHLPPQTAAEVVREAEALFVHITEESGHPPHSSSPGNFDLPFHKVRVTPRLVNSYLSVYYRHTPLKSSHQLFLSLFSELGVERNAHSYVDALERCTFTRSSHDRDVAHHFAEDVWKDWCVVENARQLPDGRPLSARMIERAHAAMIRVLALSDELDRALDLLRAFVTRYPPVAIREPPTIPAMRSTRTTLTGAHPLVRLTSATEVPDDTVPPLIGYSNLELLHHRLVVAGRTEALNYVKWVCKAYEGALRMRRDATMRAATAAEDR
ncbi:hypothetical protein EW146_g3327 [Bondarzewia mesenterica]|uniref:Pentacotripeptide-repeat region of PRORP domain-containing protein n=1 Tax=Bondarzewia mesenterica TaxID=1095465 RepID=A0A4S4LY56_9AGAM|nr:hypothetical protein EW146_g3327 [Bondarzewia mesenterica]